MITVKRGYTVQPPPAPTEHEYRWESTQTAVTGYVGMPKIRIPEAEGKAPYAETTTGTRVYITNGDNVVLSGAVSYYSEQYPQELSTAENERTSDDMYNVHFSRGGTQMTYQTRSETPLGFALVCTAAVYYEYGGLCETADLAILAVGQRDGAAYTWRISPQLRDTTALLTPEQAAQSGFLYTVTGGEVTGGE